MLDGKPFRVAGVNNHYLTFGSSGEVTRVLDDATAMGANVVRTFLQPVIGSLDGQVPTIWNSKSTADSSNLGTKGIYMMSWDPITNKMVPNDGPDGLQKVDYLIAEAAKRKLKLILAFVDFWAYTGGAQQMNAWYESSTNTPFLPLIREPDAITRNGFGMFCRASTRLLVSAIPMTPPYLPGIWPTNLTSIPNRSFMSGCRKCQPMSNPLHRNSSSRRAMGTWIRSWRI